MPSIRPVFRSALVVCATLPAVATAQRPRPALVESLHLHAATPPRTATIDGATHLVYELHLSNPTPDTLRIARVLVTGEAGRDTVALLGAEQLATALRTPGRRPTDDRGPLVAPGGHRVLYGWWRMAAGRPAPNVVGHQVEVVTPARGTVAVQRVDTVHLPRAAAALGAPLAGGAWVALYDPWMQGGHRMAFYTLEGRMRVPARFAIDFVRLPAEGRFDRRATGQERNGFGEPVLAVGDGVIVAALDDMPDQADATGAPRPSFTLEQASGNHLALRLADGRVAVYEHLRAGSVRVRVGQRVRRGDVMAALGYSGSASIGPHLHFHVADAASLLGAEGVPWTLGAFEELGRYASLTAFVEGEGPRLLPRASARRGELPAPNTVLRFPE